MSSAQP